MAVQFQSYSTANTTTDTLTISHPSGLSEGDLMIVKTETAANFTFTTPSGWTQLTFETASGHRAYVFSKEATSTDVTNGSTDFVHSDPGDAHGVMCRIDGHFGVDVSNSASGANGTTSPSLNASITPTVSDSLLMMIWSQGDTGNVPSTASGYAIATDDPTWTEQVEDFYSGSIYEFVTAIATATRPETTATGNSSVTWGTSPNAESAVALIAIEPYASNTVSHSLVTRSSSIQEHTVSVDISVSHTFVESQSQVLSSSVEVNSHADWSNQSKPSTTWKNESSV